MTLPIRNQQSAIRNSRWWLATVSVARDFEELVGAALFEAGSTGIITLDESATSVTLGAYFDERFDPGTVKQALEATSAQSGQAEALRGFSATPVPEQDWMQKWKEGFQAIEIGRRLVVAPSWKLAEQDNDRIVIQVDPGMAFGTGTHETTRLCLEAIEERWTGGSILDVGTGTGILAIAAAVLAPGSRVTAIDVDPQAVEVARENLAINGVAESVELCEAQPRDFARREFDFVVANLTAEVIVDLMTDLAGCLAPNGLMIMSGILSELASDVERALGEAGFRVVDRRDAGEWRLLAARRA